VHAATLLVPHRPAARAAYRGLRLSVLLVTHPRYLDHEPVRGHPERPARLQAVLEGIAAAGVSEGVVPLAPRPATRAELGRVHDAGHLDALERLDAGGGGWIDADTAMGEGSLDAARLAAGAGLAAIDALDRGEGVAAFCAVRPPGHHATPTDAMGFCLLNNVAVAAAALADRGERVLIVDFDAHHGNGTQDAFWADPRVAYVSLHQHPLYPGTGDRHEVGGGQARGLTLNIPLPPGTTGDAHRAAVELLVAPLAATFRPTWLLLSAGFDAHRADPLTDLGLSAGDFADLTADLAGLVPAGRRLAFLEGGYDLDALSASAGACIAALAGERVHEEAPTAGGPGRAEIHAAVLVREETVGGG
jgi:acetoin utilization deacetylase AcuC-like enzyme